MPAAWSKKDERQYKAIVESCAKKEIIRIQKQYKRGNAIIFEQSATSRETWKKIVRRCMGMAAAIVNKRRANEGRTKSKKSCLCPKGSRRMKTLKGWCYNPSTRKRARLKCKTRR